MVRDTQSVTDRIFCHFRPFFVLLSLICAPNDPEKSKFWKKNEKNVWMYYSFSTYMYIINEHHMIYGFWNVRGNREKFLPFWVSFCPFSPLTTQKIKILKLRKSPGILSFYTFVPYMTIIWCMFPEIWSVKNRMFLTFWIIFCPFTSPPLTTQKTKILKKWKSWLKILSFYTGVP